MGFIQNWQRGMYVQRRNSKQISIFIVVWMRNVPCRPRCLDTWSPDGGSVWEGYGGFRRCNRDRNGPGIKLKSLTLFLVCSLLSECEWNVTSQVFTPANSYQGGLCPSGTTSQHPSSLSCLSPGASLHRGVAVSLHVKLCHGEWAFCVPEVYYRGNLGFWWHRTLIDHGDIMNICFDFVRAWRV